jgi:hypothetical protein
MLSGNSLGTEAVRHAIGASTGGPPTGGTAVSPSISVGLAKSTIGSVMAHPL